MAARCCAPIIAFGNAVDIEVIAEGIETHEQLDTLRDLGCRYGQGYPPRPAGADRVDCATSAAPPPNPACKFRESTYRVIQWATGLVGKEAIKGIVAHPELELVGCWVHSDDKVGRDVGEIVRHRPDRRARRRTASTRSARSTPTRSCTRRCWRARRDVIRLLESGKNVVTPVGWIYPAPTRRGVAASQAACIAGNVTLHGTGINPGGITERFPLMLSALVPRHPPRARRGVLRHPQLPDRHGRARGDAVRQGRRRSRRRAR